MRYVQNFIGIVLLFIGIAILVFPVYSDYKLYTKQEEALHNFETSLDDSLKLPSNEDESIVNVAALENKVIAGLYIPSIDLKIPVYYGTKSFALENGVGLLENTDLISTEKGRHTVLTSHSGLSLSRLFTDLPNVKIGDKFFIKKVDGEVLAYEVVEKNVILPTQIEYIQNEEGRNLVTLITCVPLFINSHRLLVKGENIEYKNELNHFNEKDFLSFHKKYIFTVLLIIVSFLLILTIIKRIKYNRRLETFLEV